MRQLQYSFQEDEPWNPLTDETSILCHFMNEQELRDDDQPDKLSVIKLVCLGLTLCGGESDMKARVFYDVLQDNMQEKISSGDKDFKIAFDYMVQITCYMMLRVYREQSNSPWLTQHYPNPRSEDPTVRMEYENLLDTFREDFLDEVFDSDSNLSREEFLKKVSQKSKWVFESEDIRKRWNELCEPRKQKQEAQIEA